MSIVVNHIGIGGWVICFWNKWNVHCYPLVFLLFDECSKAVRSSSLVLGRKSTIDERVLLDFSVLNDSLQGFHEDNFVPGVLTGFHR